MFATDSLLYSSMYSKSIHKKNKTKTCIAVSSVSFNRSEISLKLMWNVSNWGGNIDGGSNLLLSFSFDAGPSMLTRANRTGRSISLKDSNMLSHSHTVLEGMIFHDISLILFDHPSLERKAPSINVRIIHQILYIGHTFSSYLTAAHCHNYDFVIMIKEWGGLPTASEIVNQ